VRAGTPKHFQQYIDPLLVMSGDEYQRATFDDIHRRICDATRGSRPRVIMEVLRPDGRMTLMLEDGSSREIPLSEDG
jgi:hypothetical protein